MNTINNNNVHTPSFRAKHLFETSVLKKLARNTENYVEQKANIIEMNFADINDATAMQTINSSWAKSQFAQIICSPSYSANRKIYAITTQTENFSKAEPDKIIGLADININDSKARLRFLQVTPKILNDTFKSTKHAGEALVKGVIQDLRQKGCKTMDWFAEPRVKPFYEKIFPQLKTKESTMESSSNLFIEI